MDDTQLLAVLERQRYRATALDISLKTGATVEDSEEALAQLLAACGGSYEFRGEIVVYIFPSNVKSKLGARRANAQFQRGLAAAATAAFAAVGGCGIKIQAEPTALESMNAMNPVHGDGASGKQVAVQGMDTMIKFEII